MRTAENMRTDSMMKMQMLQTGYCHRCCAKEVHSGHDKEVSVSRRHSETVPCSPHPSCQGFYAVISTAGANRDLGFVLFYYYYYY